MSGLLRRVAIERVTGGRPSRWRSLAASGAVGAAAGIVTYRVLRSTS